MNGELDFGYTGRDPGHFYCLAGKVVFLGIELDIGSQSLVGDIYKQQYHLVLTLKLPCARHDCRGSNRPFAAPPLIRRDFRDLADQFGRPNIAAR